MVLIFMVIEKCRLYFEGSLKTTNLNYVLNIPTIFSCKVWCYFNIISFCFQLFAQRFNLKQIELKHNQTKQKRQTHLKIKLKLKILNYVCLHSSSKNKYYVHFCYKL